LEGEFKLDIVVEKKDKKMLLEKAYSMIILSLSDKVLSHVSKEKTVVGYG